jgi:hypothetical protein
MFLRQAHKERSVSSSLLFAFSSSAVLHKPSFFDNLTIIATKKKRKVDPLTSSELFTGIDKLASYDELEKEQHKQYYMHHARFGTRLPFLPTLVEIQNTSMDPGLFASFEGKYYQWKYEKVLEKGCVWKFHDQQIHASFQSQLIINLTLPLFAPP